MPLRKNGKKKTYRKSRKSYKKYSIKAPLKMSRDGNMRIFKGCGEYQAVDLTVGQVANTGYGANFAFFFNYIPDYASLSSLYDMFRIKKIRISIIPTSNINTMYQATNVAAGGLLNYINHIHSAIEYGILVSPTQASDLQQYQTYKKTRMTRTHTRIVYPRVHVAICTPTNINVAYLEQSASNTWFDMQQAPSIAFNGLRVWLDEFSNTALVDPLTFNVYIKVWYELKNRN